MIEQIQEAAERIQSLEQSFEIAQAVQTNAKAYPLEWTTLAKTWEHHWDWTLSHPSSSSTADSGDFCAECNAELLTLPDGDHCTNCGNFSRRMLH
jgi:hypothetical protein